MMQAAGFTCIPAVPCVYLKSVTQSTLSRLLSTAEHGACFEYRLQAALTTAFCSVCSSADAWLQ